ncbi:hypothetical protein H8959_002164 [Pygathrix nigripes]
MCLAPCAATGWACSGIEWACLERYNQHFWEERWHRAQQGKWSPLQSGPEALLWAAVNNALRATLQPASLTVQGALCLAWTQHMGGRGVC